MGLPTRKGENAMINPRTTVGAMTPVKAAPIQAAARTAVNPDPAAAANDEINPLWIIAAGMAIFFAVAAVFVAAS
jgi:hypothetical protein